MLTRLSICFLALTACGSDSKGSADAAGSPDTSNIPAMVTVTGITQDIGIGGRSPLAGVVVGVYKEGETTPRAMATSDSAGMFTLTIPTMGQALDGYLLAQTNGHLDSYLYPPAPITADMSNLPILVLTQSTYDTASNLAQGGQTPGHAFIGVEAIDGSGATLADVVISSTPAGTVRYNGTNGLPNKTPTMTQADGIGYIFQVTAGTVTVSATKAGVTFRSHALNARADKVTLTLIQTQ
jgi:hypothetical protein